MLVPRHLVLAPGIRDAMVEHAHRALPLEAVGLLGGLGNRASLICELDSLGTVHYFLVDPRSQYEAERRIHATGLTILALYHSHPGGGAELSDVDIAFASRLRMLQVVIALARPHRAGCELRAYQIRGNFVEGVSLEG